MSPETTPPYQPYAQYVMDSYEIGFDLQMLNTVYDKLILPNVPQHWQGVINEETANFDIVRLSEAVNTTFQHGRKPRSGGYGYRHFDVPPALGATGLLSLTIFADAHVGYEALPDPRIPNEVAKSITKYSPKSSITAYDIFAYGDQLGYKNRGFHDENMVDIHAAWMQERLPTIPEYGTYSYDYEAASNGAFYPVANGVAFRGYTEEPYRPIDSYEFDEDLMPLPYTPDPPSTSQYIGLIPAALAADSYRDVYRVGRSVQGSTFAALLKYVKALRQAGLHDVKSPTS